MKTIQDVKDFLNQNYKDGCQCPACGQNVKQYKRKLNSGMARVLIAMYMHGDGFFHVKDHLREKGIKNTHDWTLMRYWKLIEEPLDSSVGQKVGLWKITERGKMFVRGTIIVQKHIYLLNNNFRGFSEEETNIREAIGDHFDYSELMNGI